MNRSWNKIRSAYVLAAVFVLGNFAEHYNQHGQQAGFVLAIVCYVIISVLYCYVNNRNIKEE